MQGQVILVNKVDDFTGDWHVFTSPKEGRSIRSTDYVDIDKEMMFSMAYIKPKTGILTYGIGLILRGRDIGCLVKGTGKIILLFDNDSTVELMQASDTECGGAYNSYSSIFIFASKSDLDGNSNEYTVEDNYRTASKNMIKKIRVEASKGYSDYTLLPEKRSVMIKHSNLIDSITIKKE